MLADDSSGSPGSGGVNIATDELAQRIAVAAIAWDHCVPEGRAGRVLALLAIDKHDEDVQTGECDMDVPDASRPTEKELREMPQHEFDRLRRGGWTHDLSEPNCEIAAKIHLDRLAREIQNFVPEQPWSRSGTKPVGVEIRYDEHWSPSVPWLVKFVVRVQGNRRVWRVRRGRTLPEALDAARQAQLASLRIPRDLPPRASEQS